MRKVLVLMGIIAAMMFVFSGCSEIEDAMEVANLAYNGGVVLGDLNDYDMPSGAYFDDEGKLQSISMMEDSETVSVTVEFYLVVENDTAYLRSADQYITFTCVNKTAFDPLTGDVDEVPSADSVEYSNQVAISEGSYVSAYLHDNHYAKIHVVSLIDTVDSHGSNVKRATLEAWYNLDEGSTNFYIGEDDTSDEENETGE